MARVSRAGGSTTSQDSEGDASLIEPTSDFIVNETTITSFAANIDRFRNGRESFIVTRSRSAGNGNTQLSTTVSAARTKKKRTLDNDVAPPLESAVAAKRLKQSTPKRARVSSRYAPPSKYAHLRPLQDILEHNLICVFVGTNPGVRTATDGHAYAHPSNLFWKLLHSSGCTDERLRPQQDVDLPRLYYMGNTNIVDRPSKDAAELSKAEMAAGTPILEEKFAKYQPEAICIVGKGIWEAIWRWRYKREIRKEEFKYGWQSEKERMGKTENWSGARVFVASSTSGLSASLRPHEKEAIWRPFGQWVKARREERRTKGVTAPALA